MGGGGGSKPVWNFSENSSDLLTLPVPNHGWCSPKLSNCQTKNHMWLWPAIVSALPSPDITEISPLTLKVTIKWNTVCIVLKQMTLCSQHIQYIHKTCRSCNAHQLVSSVLETDIKDAETESYPIKRSREFYVGLVLQTKTHWELTSWGELPRSTTLLASTFNQSHSQQTDKWQDIEKV